MYKAKLLCESSIGIKQQTHQTDRIFLNLWCGPNFVQMKINLKTLTAFAWGRTNLSLNTFEAPISGTLKSHDTSEG